MFDTSCEAVFFCSKTRLLETKRCFFFTKGDITPNVYAKRPLHPVVRALTTACNFFLFSPYCVNFEIDNVALLDDAHKEAVIGAHFVACNWIRELLNAFVLEPHTDTKSKVWRTEWGC